MVGRTHRWIRQVSCMSPGHSSTPCRVQGEYSVFTSTVTLQDVLSVRFLPVDHHTMLTVSANHGYVRMDRERHWLPLVDFSNSLAARLTAQLTWDGISHDSVHDCFTTCAE